MKDGVHFIEKICILSEKDCLFPIFMYHEKYGKHYFYCNAVIRKRRKI